MKVSAKCSVYLLRKQPKNCHGISTRMSHHFVFAGQRWVFNCEIDVFVDSPPSGAPMADGPTSMGPPASTASSNIPNFSTAGNTQSMGGFPRGPMPQEQAGQGRNSINLAIVLKNTLRTFQNQVSIRFILGFLMFLFYYYHHHLLLQNLTFHFSHFLIYFI